MLIKYNIIPNVDKTHKTNIIQFTHNNEGVIHMYTADLNKIHAIAYKEVKYLCNKMRLNGGKTVVQYVKQMNVQFFMQRMEEFHLPQINA